MLILTGALGNLFDRLFYSAAYLKSEYAGVVDFIDFCGIWDAVFNIADSCIVVAAIILIVYFIVEEVKDNRKKQANIINKEKVKSESEKSLENDEK